MKKISGIIVASSLLLSIFVVGISAASASAEPTAQVVQETKKVSKKVYSKGRWVTVSSWKNGKKYTKKVWKKGNSVGHKTATKTKNAVTN